MVNAYSIRMEWDDLIVTKLYRLDSYDDPDDWYPLDQSPPYPNTTKDSLVCGLLETWAQGNGYMAAILASEGHPKRVVIHAHAL